MPASLAAGMLAYAPSIGALCSIGCLVVAWPHGSSALEIPIIVAVSASLIHCMHGLCALYAMACKTQRLISCVHRIPAGA